MCRLQPSLYTQDRCSACRACRTRLFLMPSGASFYSQSIALLIPAGSGSCLCQPSCRPLPKARIRQPPTPAPDGQQLQHSHNLHRAQPQCNHRLMQPWTVAKHKWQLHGEVRTALRCMLPARAIALLHLNATSVFGRGHGGVHGWGHGGVCSSGGRGARSWGRGADGICDCAGSLLGGMAGGHSRAGGAE